MGAAIGIAYVHKLKDKASGGFIRGQSLLFLLLITPKVMIPVGFVFYLPDPDGLEPGG